MDILNSGSFVPLDNREKIEQLIFTAKTLATEVSRAEGFQSTGPTNHQLGLEMWKGAEYLCRAHEEVTIKNLFLSKFLERLREIERNSAVQARPPQPISSPVANPSDPFQTKVVTEPSNIAFPVPLPVAPSPELPPASRQQEVRDEYLGVINETPTVSDRTSYATECMPEWEAENAETNNGAAPNDFMNSLSEIGDDNDPGNSAGTTATETTSVEVVGDPDSDTSEAVVPAVEEGIECIEPEELESMEAASVESIVLADKEPYNLEACTITAVIQVLPETSGQRKCVVSLRTHDFAPLVAVSEAEAGDILPYISATLSNVLDQYRTELPGRAAEKLKKDKPAAKKQSKTGSKSAKAVTTQAKATGNSESSTVAATPVAGMEQSQGGLFAS